MKTDFLAPQNPLMQKEKPSAPRIVLSVADEHERDAIYRLRHDIYARELSQHAANSEGCLRDPLDDWNIYLLAKVGGEIAGFISLTPPRHPAYSIDKYFVREALPFPFDDRLYEIRLLTIARTYRGRELATL